MTLTPHILTINAGSSSIRFVVFEAGDAPRRVLGGKIERIGSGGTSMEVKYSKGKVRTTRLKAKDHLNAVAFLLDWLEAQPFFAAIKAIGHRVVHGMTHSKPQRVTSKLLTELHRIMPYDPEHLPREIGLIEAIRVRRPSLAQVACFDTAFHRTMPRVAKMLPIPRKFAAKGVERYGFHGLSYAYLMEELARIDPAEANGRVVLAHLGNGASMAAVRHGRSVDTSMGFSPAAGLVMSTRTGDLDPGVAYHLERTRGLTATQFQRMVNHESGLLGISQTSSDVRDLLAKERTDVRAKEALSLFCYQGRKWIGSFAAALGGLDTLVFAGGIGENAAVIRQRMCEELKFLGLELNQRRNARHAPLISSDSSRVKVRVIRTDEELMIARSVNRLLKLA